MNRSFDNLPQARQRIGTQVFGTLVIAKSVKDMLTLADELHDYFTNTLHPMVNTKASAALIVHTEGAQIALKLAIANMLGANTAFEILHSALEEWRLD